MDPEILVKFAASIIHCVRPIFSSSIFLCLPIFLFVCLHLYLSLLYGLFVLIYLGTAAFIRETQKKHTSSDNAESAVT